MSEWAQFAGLCILGEVHRLYREADERRAAVKPTRTLDISQVKTVEELLTLMLANNVPMSAEIWPKGDSYDYEGLELEWEADQSEGSEAGAVDG